jgi:hypothetical protein
MEFIELYIRSDAFILIPVLYYIGVFLRQTPFLPKWSYTWIKLIFAIIACLLYYGFEIESVIQGILVTGVAVMFQDILHHSILEIYDRNSRKK